MTTPRKQRQKAKKREALRLAAEQLEPAKEEPVFDGSHWWPVLQPELQAKAIAAGKGAEYKRVADMRLELRAINQRFPMPADVKAQMVYSAWSTMNNPQVDYRVRMAAQKNLLAMEQMNQRDENGPDQIGVQVIMPDGSTRLAGDLLDEMRKTWDYSTFDERPIKAIPGSPEDYAT
jgi:hypothetical protein